MSYHYRPGNKKEDLRRQLQAVEHQIVSDRQALDKLRLQAEFYEDKGKLPLKDKMSLADEIMNELMLAPPKYNQEPKAPASFEPVKEAYKPLDFPQPSSQANPRENHFINEREIQKSKMQNQKHEGLFPNSSDHNRVRSYGKQPQAELIPEKDKADQKVSPYGVNPLKKAASPDIDKGYNPDYNPFVRADQLQKQRKEQAHREYLRALELQKQEQQKIKEQREREKKEMKVQHYDFLPGNNPAPKAEAERPLEKPQGMRRADPNQKPPKIDPIAGNFSQFDAKLIQQKATQITAKFKRGKIIYEQYEREMNNLRKQYKGDLDDLIRDKRSERQPIAEAVIQSPKKQVYQEQKESNNSLPLRNESANFSQLANNMAAQHEPSFHLSSNPQVTQVNASSYQMVGGVPANVPAEYLQLMKKMFEVCLKEVKEVYTQRIVNQDQLYQQTLNKFVHYTQTNFMTQQIPPIQASQQQKDFYSDAKQFKEYFEKESNIKRKPASGESLSNIPFGQSDNSEYYDKSLSAIASKVPLPLVKTKGSANREDKTLREQKLNEFYNRKYRVKPLQKFAILLDPNQSQQEIPSTSKYLRTKNAFDELQLRFREDLEELKLMQLHKNSKNLSEKVKKNSSYSKERRVLREQSPKAVQSGSAATAQENPFLKKHVSTDENMMTFNEKELRTNSPISKYSPQSKKEILEQDEYQTEPRLREEAQKAPSSIQEQKVPSYIQEYEQRISFPSKALNFIRMNNQLLSKYSEEGKKDPIVIQDSADPRPKDSNYFTNNDISPVKNNEYYEESLQTIKSDFEPNSKQPEHNSKQPEHSNRHIKPKESKLSLSKKSPERLEEEEFQQDMAAYSQTVESIEESSQRNSRPPVSKRRAVSKKKESSIARSKLNQESSLSKPFSNQSLSQMEPVKFDSNVYESEYEQSAEYTSKHFQPNRQLIINAPHEREQQSAADIEIYVPTIIHPKSAIAEGEAVEQKSKLSQPQGKLKSLEQARKLAKQYRAKAIDQSKDFRSVQERFSQLQSFMTKRGDESIVNIRKEQAREKSKEKSKEKSGEKAKGKKDIMKMLEELQDNEEEYKQEFESYREESEQYQ